MSDERKLTLRDADEYDFNGQRDRIVELAGRGYSAAYIARTIGLTAPTVTRILRNEFLDRNQNRQQIIQAHSQTVQWLKMKCTEALANPGLDKNGNEKDWDRKTAELLLKVLERESRLFGIDQPVQHEVTVAYEDQSEEELLSQLQAAGYALQISIPPKALPQSSPIEDAEYNVNGDEGRTENTAGEGSEGE